MEIQSIYGGKKTAAAAQPSMDEDKAPANGFAALLDLVGSQFKGTPGVGTMDPAVLKTETNAAPARAAEPRDTKARPERSDDKDAKAKPAKDDKDDDDAQAEESAAADQSDGTEAAHAETQNGQQQAVQASVAAVDATLVNQTAAPTTAAAVPTDDAATGTGIAETDTTAAESLATAEAQATTDEIADPKAALPTQVKTAAPETVAKDAARVQQAMNAYAPTQETQATETVQVDTEAAAAATKSSGKDTAARPDAMRSAAAQEQASNLARLLGNENRIQIQVQTNAAHAAKPAATPDVSIYNIYSGYTAAAAVSLANGQFGQAEGADTAPQPAPTQRADAAAAQAAVVAQATLPGGGAAGSTTNANMPARADVSPVAVQANAASNSMGGGASNANMGFSAFTQSGQSTQGAPQAAQANPTDRPAATAQQVIDQIKVNITKAAKAGLDRVTIHLKPVELGRIEIKLEMSEDHKVRVTVTADNKDTLNLLQMDSRALERTLNDAGLRTDANNLHFNLRGDGDAGAADGQRGHGGSRNNGNAHAETANDNADQAYDYTAAAYARGGVDTFA